MNIVQLGKFFAGIMVLTLPHTAHATCTTQYEPVCAVNQQRYSNACYAKEAGTSPRSGGALIELQDSDSSFFFWSTNNAFIDEAIDIVNGASPQRIPVFNDLSAGADCSQPHIFQVDPSNMEFADMTIELCDATASYIDDNLSSWLNEVDQWCPWSAQILAVYDYR